MREHRAPERQLPQRGTINIVTDVVAQGRYAARFDLPYGEINTNGQEKPSACEALRGRTLGLGTDDFYALDVRFPRTGGSRPGLSGGCRWRSSTSRDWPGHR